MSAGGGFPAEDRGPLMAELERIARWIYEHEHRGSYVTEDLYDIAERLERRAWQRGDDHLPLKEDEA